MGAWQVLANPFRRTDEIQPVVVVFLHTCGHSQHIGVENDVKRIETNLVHQQMISTFTYLYLTFVGSGLPLLIEGHHHRSSTQTFDFMGFFEEFLFTLLQRDAVDDTLALHTFQTSLDNLPIAGVNHHGHLRDVRVAHQQIEESHHFMLSVQEAIIHVDVEHQCPIFHLLSCYGKGFFVVLLIDETQEFP